MIRHTVEVKSDADVHTGELCYYLQGLQDGDSVKLRQGDSTIYLTYRTSEKIHERQVSLSHALMELNGVDEGSCVVESYPCSKLQHLMVKVSQLDWKIVNQNQMRIAQSFLEQITVVWPCGTIPIYYDENNYVTLVPLCDKIGKLDVNTTVEFVEQEKEAREGEEQEEERQECEERMVLSGHCDYQEGWLNRITVSKRLLESMELQNNQPWIIDNLLEFSGCPQINELVQLQKQRQAEDGKNEPSTKKLVILSTDTLCELSSTQFQCSKLCKKVLGLSDHLCFTNNPISKPKTEALSFQIFMNDPSWSITIEQIIKSQQLYNSLQFDQKSSKITKIFIIDLIQTLYKKGSFYFISDVYPYSLDKELFILRLVHKKKKSQGVIYEVKLTNEDSSIKKGFYQNQLEGKVEFVSRRYPESLRSTLGQRYEDVERWIAVVKEYMEEEKEKHQEESKEESMVALFNSVYQAEFDKIMHFVENQSSSVCLLTSLGSNGKSLLHRILEREGQRMWRVSFRELTNPSLTYSNIQFYLHYVFSCSPYKFIYLDDLDALCSKIEQGDQHKKKQKIISKLILKIIKTYLNLYKKRIIVTAKSQAALDEQFKADTVITLRNPNHEQRKDALRAIHVVVEPDDSPVHVYGKRLPGVRRVTEDKISSVAENTESLTLAAFGKHAIDLSLPVTHSKSEVFDFSKLAGLVQAKQAVRDIIEKPIKYAFLFKSVPIKLPRGVLLYGATGNGKSAMGTSLKDEFKMKYFTVKGSDILSKYIGGSEAAVRDIFERALAVSPSIIFFDEFESIVPKRSANNTGVNDRIVNQFLCYLDGVSSISGVYIIAASSRPDLIDPAVLRPGRLDAHLFLDYPKEEERRELIEMFGDSVKIDLEVEKIVAMTENYSYSDMIGLMKELRIKRSAEVLKQDQYESSEFKNISQQFFLRTLEGVKLSVGVEDQKRQRRVFEAFRDGKAPDVGKQKHIQY